ncbi:MAG: gamma-glutamylcyclotransferase [Pseudonocardiaceae bacterium]
MPGDLRDADYPADPYPGARPSCSFLHREGGRAHHLQPAGPGQWRVGDETLNDWLRQHGVPGVGARMPVLAYGSNACPSKITWLREELGLTGPVPVLRCRTVGVSAVWCAGVRARDGQVPAVLVAAPGRQETHAVWLASAEQLAVLDICEGRGERYDLVHLEGDAEVRTEDGTVLDRPLAYTACGRIRAPMVHDGRFVSLTEVDQAGARRLLDQGTHRP